MKRAPPAEGLWTKQVIADSTTEDLWPGATEARSPTSLHCRLVRQGSASAAHARRLFLVQGSHPSLGRPFFLSTCFALRRVPRPPVCTHARSRTHGRPTDERRDVRSAGVADWKTARRGSTERTLTAAAGPSPCDPYRHALTMRPPQKVRPFSFLNYSSFLVRNGCHKNLAIGARPRMTCALVIMVTCVS